MPAAIQNTIHLYIPIEADATGGVGFTIPRDLLVVGCSSIATATVGGGATVTVASPDGAITDAFNMATANAAVTAGEIDLGNALLSAGDTLTVTTSAAAARGVVIVRCHAVPAPTLDEAA